MMRRRTIPKQVLFTPTCGSCHQEHRSRARLIEVREQACVECHKT